jgi:diguanylate cyclase (GGDEF)-like protein
VKTTDGNTTGITGRPRQILMIAAAGVSLVSSGYLAIISILTRGEAFPFSFAWAGLAALVCIVLAVIIWRSTRRFITSSWIIVTTLFPVTLLHYIQAGESSGRLWMLLFPVVAVCALGYRMGGVIALIPAIGLIIYRLSISFLPAGNSLMFPVTIPFILVYLLLAVAGAATGYSLKLIQDQYNDSVSVLQSIQLQYQQLSTVDELTGMYNRRHIIDCLVDEIMRFNRYHTPFSLVMIDFDSFKTINSRYGHLAGDVILKETATMIKETIVRQVDHLGRYSGEEFLLVLPETDLEGAGQVAERVSKAVAEREYFLDDTEEPIRVTVSAGASVIDEHKELNRILYEVTAALSSAREAGPGNVRTWKAGMDDTAG